MINNKRILLYFLIIMSVTTTQSAYAFDLFSPVTNDWLVKNVIAPLFYPDNSPFGTVSEVFLAGILTFGGVLAGYTLLVGTMNTAHDGEMLGKKWSTMWVPIRTTLGVAMILPIKGGFCAIQLIIVWLGVQGIGLADQAWNAFASQPLRGAVFVQPSMDRQIQELYKNAVKASACVASLSDQVNRSTAGLSGVSEFLQSVLKIKPGITSKIIDNSSGGKTYLFLYGDKTGPLPISLCGSIKYDTGSLSDALTNNAPAASKDLLDLNMIQTRMVPVNVAAINALVNNAATVGIKIATSGKVKPEEIANNMTVAVNAYKLAVLATANVTFNDAVNKNSMNAMKEDGFAAAGSWFIRLTTAQSKINNIVNNIPVSSTQLEGFTQWAASMFSADLQATMAKTDNLFNETDVLVNTGITAGKSDSLFDKIGEKIAPSELAAIFSNEATTENPVSAMMSLGHKLIAIAIALYAVVTVLVFAAGTGTLIASGGVISAVVMIAPLFTAVAVTMLVQGIRLAYILAYKPFVIWCGAIVGWIVLLCEAVFAGPLWAVAHLAPDADGIVGKMGQGYMLILSLVLRPILMVIGYIVALSLLTPCMMFINYFFSFTQGDIATGWPMILGKLAVISVYVSLLHGLIDKLFALIHTVPDKLLQWIGGALSNNMGEYANGIDTGGATTATNRMNTGLGQLSGVAQKATSRNANDRLDRMKQNKKSNMNQSE